MQSPIHLSDGMNRDAQTSNSSNFSSAASAGSCYTCELHGGITFVVEPHIVSAGPGSYGKNTNRHREMGKSDTLTEAWTRMIPGRGRMTNEKQSRHDSSLRLRFLLATVFSFALILPASSFTPPPLLSSSRVSPKITRSTSLNEHVVSQEAFAKKCAHVCLGVLLTVSQLTPIPPANALDLSEVSLSLPEVSLSLPTVTLSSVSLPAAEQQRSTENMSVTERKEFEKQQKILQRRIELDESLQKLRSDQKEIQVREQLSYEKQQLSIQRAEEAKLKEKLEFQERRLAAQLQGSEEAVAAPVYGYNEGKSFLVEKLAVEQQRSTENMSVTERKEFEKQQKILQRRIELDESLQKLRSDQNAGQKEIQARGQLAYEKQQLSIQRTEEAKLKEKLVFQERQLAAQNELEVIKDRQNQRVFEGKMEAFDKFDAREDQLNALREAAQQGK